MSAGITFFEDRDLPDGSTFCYRVRASNTDGFSDYSDKACGTIQWPSLDEIEPWEATPKDEVRVSGHGGYIRIGTSGYDESSRPFALYFDGSPVGAIGCYVTSCRGSFVVPVDAPMGDHEVCAQGGSCITLRTVQQFALDTRGTLSGHVYEADGRTPIANVEVFAEDYPTGEWIDGTNTKQDDSYMLTLPTGSYRVQACPSCSDIVGLVREWYDGTIRHEDATPVAVVAPDDTAGIDFTWKWEAPSLATCTRPTAGPLLPTWRSSPRTTRRVSGWMAPAPIKTAATR